MKFLGIIPARYASTRFPGKPLALIGGVPMIVCVARRARQVLDRVLVATDDRRIADAVTADGSAIAVMTSPDCPSGTDRVCQALDLSGEQADVVINIQGDEPFIDPRQIGQLMDCFRTDPSTEIATLIRPFDPGLGYDELANPNKPKVVVDDRGNALMFSRSVIPFVRGAERPEWPRVTQYFTHVGMYGYRADTLRRLTRLQRSPLEIAESLEQLRWLQNGYRIATAVTDIPTIGIDTPEDFADALKKIAPDHD